MAIEHCTLCDCPIDADEEDCYMPDGRCVCEDCLDDAEEDEVIDFLNCGDTHAK